MQAMLAWGPVLQQNGYPIAYISKAFDHRSQGLSVHEELLTITFVFQKWRHYVEQGLYYIKSDHENIKHLLE